METAAWLEKKTVLPSADPDQQMLEQKEQGKEGKNRYRNLRKLGTSERNAGIMANTRKGYRRSADSPIVKLAISKDLLKKAGYTFFFDYYLSVKT